MQKVSKIIPSLNHTHTKIEVNEINSPYIHWETKAKNKTGQGVVEEGCPSNHGKQGNLLTVPHQWHMATSLGQKGHQFSGGLKHFYGNNSVPERTPVLKRCQQCPRHSYNL